MSDGRERESASDKAEHQPGDNLWRSAYEVAEAKPLPKRDAGKAEIKWTPEGKVDGTFTTGEHNVTEGTYIASGDAKIHAEGTATVYASDEATVEGNETVTIYASGKSTAHANDRAVIYAKDESTAYGFDNATVHAYDRTEVHAHDRPTVYAHDQSEINANDSSTTYAYDHCVVWPREPMAPDRDVVHAFDNVVVVTSQNQNDKGFRPQINLHDQSVWIDYDPRFGVPITNRSGNK